MSRKNKGGVAAALMATALLGWASSPAAAAVRIEGQVRPGLETISCGRETTDRNIEHRIA